MLRTFDFCGFTTRPDMAANMSRVLRRLGEEINGDERKRRMSSANRQSL